MKSLPRCRNHSLSAGIRYATTEELADEILATEHYAKDLGGELYHYNGKVYVSGGEDHIKSKVVELLRAEDLMSKWTVHKGNEVVELIRIGVPELWERPSLDKIVLRNGILNLDTMTLDKATPNHRTTVWLPVNYDPDATCPEWERFIGQVFPSDSQDIAWEIPGLLMTPFHIQKAILLYGPSGNGKSTYLNAIKAFLGLHNVSVVALHTLEERFGSWGIIGKLANIYSDLPNQTIRSLSIFKAITGGDDIQVEHKFSQPYRYHPFCRLVFSANHPPQSRDADQATFDRWEMISLSHRFRGEQEERPQEELLNILATPQELSGLLNMAIVAWRRITQGNNLTESESMSEISAEFFEVSDPFVTWMRRRTRENPRSVLPCAILRDTYNAERQPGVAPMMDTPLGLKMKERFPNVKRAQHRVGGGNPRWCYVGLELLAL